MGYATTSWADLVEENDGIKIMELVGLFLGLLATCFCWQLCSIASTSNTDGLQQPLHPSRADVQTILEEQTNAVQSTANTNNAAAVDETVNDAHDHITQ